MAAAPGVPSDLAAILPEIVLAAVGMVLLVLPRLRSGRLLGLAALAALAAAFDLQLIGWLARPFWAEAHFSGMLVQDAFGGFFALAVLAAMGLVVLSLMGYAGEAGVGAGEEVRGRRETYSLLLFAAAGLLFLIQAQHLALLYLALELVSILSYLLVGFQKKESLAIEGALKYFLFGALSTGTMLYGISLLYGLTGRLDLASLAARLPEAMESSPGLAWLGLLLLFVGLGFKLALVPFHMWAPDAYEGASAPVASFISLGPKLAGFAVLARISWIIFPHAGQTWGALLAALAVVTMTVGNLAALAQTNVKRLLAYSSIAHAGTVLIGLAVGTPAGLAALLYYVLAYLLMNAGAFVGVIIVGNAAQGRPASGRPGRTLPGRREDLSAFSGLSQRQPMLAALIALCFLSLAGIPPLAGFFAKLWIFAAALRAEMPWLAVAAAVNSVIAVYYYVRVIQAMYLDPAPAGAGPVPRSGALGLALTFCAAGLLFVGLWQGPWLDLARAAFPSALNAAALPWR